MEKEIDKSVLKFIIAIAIKENQGHVMSDESSLRPLPTLTEMDNYFPGAFFTLVPINPNPVNPSWIRVKTQPQT